MSSSPTRFDRPAASSRSAGDRQPPRRRIAYRFMLVLLGRMASVAADATRASLEAHPEECLSSGEPEPRRLGSRLAPRRHLELPQDRRDVVVDGALGDEEPRADLAVPQPFGDEC